MFEFWFVGYVVVLNFIMLMVGVCLISVMHFREQFLISLLSLELVVLGMFLMMLIGNCYLLQPMSSSFYLLILGACEASLGLTLLVVMTRFKGNDVLTAVGGVKY